MKFIQRLIAKIFLIEDEAILAAKREAKRQYVNGLIDNIYRAAFPEDFR